jgi:hypothetical protein
MGSPCCLCVCVSRQRLKVGTDEPEETAVGRQRLRKHVPAATNTHATTEGLLDAVFYMRSVSYQILHME